MKPNLLVIFLESPILLFLAMHVQGGENGGKTIDKIMWLIQLKKLIIKMTDK